ncbi:phosphotransferase [Bradyrhizobium sp. LjRoot220]|uniref:phosphotransferase n=1 Tax=Bradyrhizobium sp. LjRoot220 TaxID=3342284 RepID=UPI003ECEF270
MGIDEPEHAPPEVRDRRGYENSLRILLPTIRRDQNSDETLTTLDVIIDSATRALGIPYDNDIADDVFLSYRGCAFFGKYQFRRERRATNLENALRDFGLISKHNNPNVSTYVQALLSKSYMQKAVSPDEALATLGRAMEVARTLRSRFLREKLEKQIGLNIAECLLRIAVISDDTNSIKENCESILSHGTQAHSAVLPLFHAAQKLLDAPPDTHISQLVQRIAKALDAASQQPNLNTKSSVTLSAHAAQLSLALGSHFKELALRQNLRVLEADPNQASPMKLSTIGRLALDIGKEVLRDGDVTSAQDRFRESIEWTRKSVVLARNSKSSKNFSVTVAHCCLGEAYLRLQAIVGGATLARRALRHFETAQKIGRTSPEVFGLMGDAHFRLGRYLREPFHLRKALELKRTALISYKATREALSICGAALLLLYQLEGSSECLEEAVTSCLSAHDLDPKWPWPLLQLARIVDGELAPAAIQRVSAALQCGSMDARHLSIELKKRAVELIIENTEFVRQVIGGRTGVFVLSDQHRLISGSIVLKPTSISNARREVAATTEFSLYLKSLGVGEKYALPTPITLKNVDADTCIYAMECVDGQTLSQALLDLVIDGQDQAVLETLGIAVRFLATYHAWELQRNDRQMSMGDAAREISGVAAIMKLSKDRSTQLCAVANSALQLSVPLLPKKDAHPDNWLVTSNGLFMLDLESSGVRPACFEVAQLLDDYGLIEISESGFQTRLGLMQIYLNTMAELGKPIAVAEPSAEELYSFFWALRCGFGLGYCRRHSRVASSSAQRRLSDRKSHYRKALQFLAARFTNVPLGALASMIGKFQDA